MEGCLHVLLLCRFVVKALDASGRKVFVNVCMSEHVIQPSAWQHIKVRRHASA